MCTLFSATRRQLYTTVKFNFNVLQCTLGSRQYMLNGYLFLIHSLMRAQFYTSPTKLNMDISPSISHKMNIDIHIWTNDYSLRVYSGPFDHAYICQEYGLEPRHLQKIGSDLFINISELDVYPSKFICFSFRRHRCIVKHDQCIFFVSLAKTRLPDSFKSVNIDRWKKIVHSFNRKMQYIHKQCNQRFSTKSQTNLSSKSITETPFEFKTVEVILDSLTNNYKLKTRELIKIYENVQEKVYRRISIDNLRELALLKVKVDHHRRNGDLACKTITDLQVSDHNEVERILEACAKQMTEVCRTIYDLDDSLQTLETTTGFALDTVRSDLLAFIVGVYGMNILNGLESEPAAFYRVLGGSACLIVGLIVVGMTRLLVYRRIRLSRKRKRT
ncbi:unnamed protein product [Rotaria socialis]|uniref:Magnesium transporter MRS2 homolog, mitochondrial n=2 Tax=Rotaria socialis TaxID=392032 RepID=A0A820MJZ0_9BILA|nr:unnamed protein product [Rotaria socialis]